MIEYYSRISPQKTALIDSANDQSISYLSLYERVEILAARLNSFIHPHDLVVAISRSRLTLVELILACSRIGVRCLPIVEPDAIEPTLVSTRRQQVPTVFYSNHEDCKFFNTGERWVHIEQFNSAKTPLLDQKPPQFVPDADSPFYVNTTGGTTGFPKLVVASHRHVLSNTLFALKAFDFNQEDIHLSTFQFHSKIGRSIWFKKSAGNWYALGASGMFLQCPDD